MREAATVDTCSVSESTSRLGDVPKDRVIYESDRSFQVFSWGAPHALCVLRSNPGRNLTGRVEIAFKPADAVALPFHLDGMRIVVARRFNRAMREVLAAGNPTGLTPFVVRSNRSQGWVLAGGVTGRSDDKDYWAPPIFDEWGLKVGELQLFTMKNDQRR